MQANMLMGRLQVKGYLKTHSEQDAKSFQQYLGVTDSILAELLAAVKNPERLAKLNAANNNIDTYAKAFETVVTHTREADRLDSEVLANVGREIEQRLTKIMDEANQQETTALAAKTLRSLLLARLYVRRFIGENEQKDVERVNQEWAEFGKNLSALGIVMQDAQRRSLLDEVMRYKDEYKNAFERMVQLTVERNRVVTETLDILGAKFAADLDDVKLSYKAEQDMIRQSTNLK